MKSPAQLTKKILFRYALQSVVLGVMATAAVLFFTVEKETLDQLEDFDWTVGFFLLGAIVTAWLCNGCRIYTLCRSLGYPLTYRQSLAVSLSSEFGIAATPAGVGGAAIRLTLLRRAGVPWAHGTSMLAIDVALDTLFFTLLIPFAIYSILNNPKIPALFDTINVTGLAVGCVLIALLIITIVLFFRNHGPKRLTDCLARRTWARANRLPGRFRLMRWRGTKEIHKLKAGIAHLCQLKRGALILTFFLASVQWTCRYGILPLILFAMDLPNDPVLLFLLQGVVFTVSLVVVLPGGGGGVEVLMALVLQRIIPGSLVGVVLLLWRFFTYHLYLFGGGSTFFWTCARINRLFPPTGPVEASEISFNGTE